MEKLITEDCFQCAVLHIAASRTESSKRSQLGKSTSLWPGAILRTAFITAHKKERCIGASNATLRQRRTQVAWLEGLLRTTGHILVPG
uniref:Uncharacterized protein n=1 Tax=Ascaris lumbricoides TaxID=6252 RepID=A0A0M3HGT9_ASCLU